MKKFYRRDMLEQRHRPPAAACAPRNRMAARPALAAPEFWAGFVLQGDWQ